MRKTRVILISLLLYGQFGTDLIVHTLAHAIEVSSSETITINKKSSRQNAEEKAKTVQ